MRKVGFTFMRYALVGALVLWAARALACNVPVFRYALERWEADPYEVVVFFRGPFTAEQKSALDRLEKAATGGLANLTVTQVDLSGNLPEPLRNLWQTQTNPAMPWIVARYPRHAGIETPAWCGPLTAESVQALLDSPVRQDIARRLLAGEAVVWLLVGSGDTGKDEAAAKLVDAELAKLEQSLVLPERSPLDPPVNPDVPLKIAFSTLRIGRSDPAEGVLLSLLRSWNTNRTTTPEVMLVPVFGRGRAVPPAVGTEIHPGALREMAEFLTGPCSCEVKEMNPGYDLLMTANWSALAGYQEVMLPDSALVSMSGFVAGATNPPAATNEPSPRVSVAVASPASPPVRESRLARNLVVVLIAGFLFLTIATLVLRARGGRDPR